MAAPKLTAEQKAKVIEMLAARETYPTIAKEVGCGVDNIKYYAAKYNTEIDQARREYDAQFVERGLRSSQKRIEKLESMANRIERDLEDTKDPKTGKVKSGLWKDDVKLAGNNVVPILTFAGESVRQYRGILDDIAKELGHRATKQELTGRDGGPVEVDISDVSNLTARERLDRLNTLLQSARNRGSVPASESGTGE